MILRPPSLRDRLILPDDPFIPAKWRQQPERHTTDFLMNPHRFGGGGGGGGAWTWNPLDKGSAVTLTNSNATAEVNGNSHSVRGSSYKTSGVWQFEVTVNLATNCFVGFAHAAHDTAFFPGSPNNSNAVGYYAPTGNQYGHTANSAYGASYVAGDVIGAVVNFTTQQITFYKNGVSQGVSAYGIPFTQAFPIFGSGGASSPGPKVTINSTLTYPVVGASVWDGTSHTIANGSCVLLLNANGANGTNTFVDVTGKTQDSVLANCVHDTAQFKYGSASMNCTGGRLYYADSADWYFAKNDLTVEAWVRGNAAFTGGRCFLLGQANSGGGGGTISIGKNTGGQFTASVTPTSGSGGTAVGGTGNVANQWYHIAMVRWGNSVLLWRDGVLSGRGEMSQWADTPNSTSKFAVGGAGEYTGGGYGGSYGDRWAGWIDDFRVVKGKAVYTAPFTPPVAELTTSY